MQAIINFSKKRELAKERGEPGPNLGIGFAMAVGLFLLTFATSVGQHQVRVDIGIEWLRMLIGVLLVLLARNGFWRACEGCTYQVYLQARCEFDWKITNVNIEF